MKWQGVEGIDLPEWSICFCVIFALGEEGNAYKPA